MPKICIKTDCDIKSHCKGLCEIHYGRLKRNQEIPLRNVQSGNDVQRFLKKIKKDENGCWLWQAGRTKGRQGRQYGKHFTDDKKTVSSHRFSYSNFVDKIPKGMFVCHKCDVPLCVNPEHLFLGTHKDNMRNMVNKKRQHIAYGGKMHTSKLTDLQAREILDSDKSILELCNEYNVSRITIVRILKRETYRNA